MSFAARLKKWEMVANGLVSHLAVGFEAAASDGRPLWSPSLLLYVGREVGDLMLGVLDWDGEEEVVGFAVDDRSSMLPVEFPVSAGRTFGNLRGRGCGLERWCGSGREGVCELGESGAAAVRLD